MTMSEADRHGRWIFGGVFVFAFLLLGTLAYQAYTRPQFGSDNCVYAGKGLSGQRVPTEQTVLLIDQSEALTTGQIRGVSQKIEEFILDDTRFPVGSRIMFFSFSKYDFPDVGNSVPSFRPVIDLCKPRLEGNPLSENNRRIRTIFLNTFI